MQQINPQRALRVHEQSSITQRTCSTEIANFTRPSRQMIESGVNALDLVDATPARVESMMEAKLKLEANYGAEFSPNKFMLLWSEIRDAGWTDYRFMETFRWFLRNKQYPSWTIADWFQYGVKVYPYEWTLDKNGDYESYELPTGVTVYKPRDGVTLPFPEPELMCLQCGKRYPRSGNHSFHTCLEVPNDPGA